MISKITLDICEWSFMNCLLVNESTHSSQIFKTALLRSVFHLFPNNTFLGTLTACFMWGWKSGCFCRNTVDSLTMKCCSYNVPVQERVGDTGTLYWWSQPNEQQETLLRHNVLTLAWWWLHNYLNIISLSHQSGRLNTLPFPSPAVSQHLSSLYFS